MGNYKIPRSFLCLSLKMCPCIWLEKLDLVHLHMHWRPGFRPFKSDDRVHIVIRQVWRIGTEDGHYVTSSVC